METEKKRCSACKIEMSLTEFNICKATKDGLQSRCKTCIKAHGHKYYQANKAKLNERQKWRRSGPKAKEARKKVQRRRHERQIKEDAADCAEHYEKRKAIKKIANKKYNDKLHLIKAKKSMSFQTVNAAVKSGSMVRPATCSICSVKTFIVAYHEDYDKPLVVIWMCIECYKKKKKENK